jgi:catechol 2,3-dioxygenase-like lactoylglutathione lyase family enzyme
MSQDAGMNRFMEQYVRLAKRCKREGRMLFNHFCIRVEDIDAAEKLLTDSFGISGFVRPGGDLFKGEKELSVAWLNESMYLELMEPSEKQDLGYDTGCGHAIGHLSEIGFFVPDMDRELDRLARLGWKVTDSIQDHGARMVKIDTDSPSGFPAELIEIMET